MRTSLGLAFVVLAGSVCAQGTNLPQTYRVHVIPGAETVIDSSAAGVVLISQDKIWTKERGVQQLDGSFNQITQEGYSLGVRGTRAAIADPLGNVTLLPEKSPEGVFLRRALYRTKDGTLYGATDSGLWIRDPRGNFRYPSSNLPLPLDARWSVVGDRLFAPRSSFTPTVVTWHPDTNAQYLPWGHLQKVTTDGMLLTRGIDNKQRLYSMSGSFEVVAEDSDFYLPTAYGGYARTVTVQAFEGWRKELLIGPNPNGRGGGHIGGAMESSNVRGLGFLSLLANDDANNVVIRGYTSKDLTERTYYLEAVPEPSSILGLGAALGAFLARRKLRRRNLPALALTVLIAAAISPAAWGQRTFTVGPTIAPSMYLDRNGIVASIAPNGTIAYTEDFTYPGGTWNYSHSRRKLAHQTSAQELSETLMPGGLPVIRTSIISINSHGTTIGRGYVRHEWYPLVWDAAGVLTNLNSDTRFGSDLLIPTDLNDAGWIVGIEFYGRPMLRLGPGQWDYFDQLPPLTKKTTTVQITESGLVFFDYNGRIYQRRLDGSLALMPGQGRLAAINDLGHYLVLEEQVVGGSDVRYRLRLYGATVEPTTVFVYPTNLSSSFTLANDGTILGVFPDPEGSTNYATRFRFSDGTLMGVIKAPIPEDPRILGPISPKGKLSSQGFFLGELWRPHPFHTSPTLHGCSVTHQRPSRSGPQRGQPGRRSLP